jgi:hypothetical protein
MARVRPRPDPAQQAKSDRSRRAKQRPTSQPLPQNPIALSCTAAEATRDFVPWRFSDACNRRAQPSTTCQASEKPTQEPTTASSSLTQLQRCIGVKRPLKPSVLWIRDRSCTNNKVRLLSGGSPDALSRDQRPRHESRRRPRYDFRRLRVAGFDSSRPLEIVGDAGALRPQGRCQAGRCGEAGVAAE